MRLSLGSFPFLDFLCEDLLEDVFTGGLKILATNSHSVQELVLLVKLDLCNPFIAIPDSAFQRLDSAISRARQMVCQFIKKVVKTDPLVLLQPISRKPGGITDRLKQVVDQLPHLATNIGLLNIMAEASLCQHKLKPDIFEFADKVEI